jgi:hypothetical protein
MPGKPRQFRYMRPAPDEERVKVAKATVASPISSRGRHFPAVSILTSRASRLSLVGRGTGGPRTSRTPCRPASGTAVRPTDGPRPPPQVTVCRTPSSIDGRLERVIARDDAAREPSHRQRPVARGPVRVRSLDDGQQHPAMHDQHGIHLSFSKSAFMSRTVASRPEIFGAGIIASATVCGASATSN